MTAPDASDSWTYALDASCAHVKNFTAVLSTVRLSRRQRARVRADARGMTFSTRDVSKSCAASANFRADVFQSYACDETAALMHSSRHFARGVVEFDVDLGALIDVMGAFAGARGGDADARLRWPNRDGALALELDGGRGSGRGERDGRQCVYAEISPETMADEEEEGEEESFRDETRAFMMPTATLKEIVDDLEWPCGNVRVEMDLEKLRFIASGAEVGTLAVDVDATEGRLTEFTCREPTTSTYKYRFLKAATAVAGNFLGGGGGSGGGGANAGDDGVTMTRASISARGFLKIVHLLHLSRNDVSFAASELNAFMVPVTFVVHPEDDLDDDDEHDDENERET